MLDKAWAHTTFRASITTLFKENKMHELFKPRAKWPKHNLNEKLENLLRNNPGIFHPGGKDYDKMGDKAPVILIQNCKEIKKGMFKDQKVTIAKLIAPDIDASKFQELAQGWWKRHVKMRKWAPFKELYLM